MRVRVCSTSLWHWALLYRFVRHTHI